MKVSKKILAIFLIVSIISITYSYLKPSFGKTFDLERVEKEEISINTNSTLEKIVSRLNEKEPVIKFTPKESGLYSLTVYDIENGSKIEYFIKDSRGKEIYKGYFTNDEITKEIQLTENNRYKLHLSLIESNSNSDEITPCIKKVNVKK